MNNPFKAKVTVRNSETNENLVPEESCLDYYFKTMHIPPVIKDVCPSCGKVMYRKIAFPNCKNEDIMVGGHVEWTLLKSSKYIIPICKECNDRKLNLPPFEVEFNKLCHISLK